MKFLEIWNWNKPNNERRRRSSEPTLPRPVPAQPGHSWDAECGAAALLSGEGTLAEVEPLASSVWA